MSQQRLLLITPNMDPCRECGAKDRRVTVKLISTNRSGNYPKYVPQLKMTCEECDTFIKFSKQTPEFIDVINAWLSKRPIEFKAEEEWK